MASIVFEGDVKCIDIIYGAGETSFTISWQEIYSLWVDWVNTSPNSKYELAFDNIMVPAGSGFVGPYFIIKNGWVICPEPYLGIPSTELILTGDAFPEIVGTPTISYDDVPAGQHTHVISNISYISITNVVNASETSFTLQDRQMLQSISADTVDIKQEKLSEIRFKELAFNRVNTIVGQDITKYRPNDEFDVNVVYDVNKIPISETIQ